MEVREERAGVKRAVKDPPGRAAVHYESPTCNSHDGLPVSRRCEQVHTVVGLFVIMWALAAHMHHINDFY